MTGGGLLRSYSEWKALKGLRKAGIRVKGDGRILGGSDFVRKVLNAVEEKLEHKYELKAKRYDFDRTEARVAEALTMAPEKGTPWANYGRRLKPGLCYVFGRIDTLVCPLAIYVSFPLAITINIARSFALLPFFVNPWVSLTPASEAG